MTRLLFRGRPTGAALTLAVALIAGGYGIAYATRITAHNPPATFHFANPAESGSHDGFAPVVKKVLPEVVNISSSKVVKVPTGFSPGMDPFFQQFFGGNLPQGNQTPRSEKEQSLGSGVIVSPEGYILTNNHVVDGATDVRVTLSDKREFTARVVGTDPQDRHRRPQDRRRRRCRPSPSAIPPRCRSATTRWRSATPSASARR